MYGPAQLFRLERQTCTDIKDRRSARGAQRDCGLEQVRRCPARGESEGPDGPQGQRQRGPKAVQPASHAEGVRPAEPLQPLRRPDGIPDQGPAVVHAFPGPGPQRDRTRRKDDMELPRDVHTDGRLGETVQEVRRDARGEGPVRQGRLHRRRHYRERPGPAQQGRRERDHKEREGTRGVEGTAREVRTEGCRCPLGLQARDIHLRLQGACRRRQQKQDRTQRNRHGSQRP